MIFHDDRIQSNTIYNLLKTVSNFLIPLLMFSYASKILEPESVGKINYSKSIVSYFTLFASLGVATYATRECAKYRDDKKKLKQIAEQILSINLLTTFISYIALFALLYIFDFFDGYENIIFLLSGNILFTTLGTDWLFSAMEDYRFITLRSFTIQIIGFILVILFVRKPDDYLIYVFISLAVAIFTCFVNILYRKKYCKLGVTLNVGFSVHFKSIVLLFVLILSQTIFTNVDITIIGSQYGDYDSGLYSTAVNIYLMISSFATIIYMVILPKITVAYRENNVLDILNLEQYSLNYIFTVGMPLLIGAEFLTEEIVTIVCGKEFINCVPELRVLMLALPFVFLGGGFLGNVICIGRGKEGLFDVSYIIAALVNLVLNLLLIPRLGPIIAAWTTVFSEMIIFLILSVIVTVTVPLRSIFLCILKPLLGSVILVPIILIIKSFIDSYIVRCIICVILCMGVFFITQVCMKNPLIMSFIKFRRKNER